MIYFKLEEISSALLVFHNLFLFGIIENKNFFHLTFAIVLKYLLYLPLKERNLEEMLYSLVVFLNILFIQRSV